MKFSAERFIESLKDKQKDVQDLLPDFDKIGDLLSYLNKNKMEEGQLKDLKQSISDYFDQTIRAKFSHYISQNLSEEDSVVLRDNILSELKKYDSEISGLDIAVQNDPTEFLEAFFSNTFGRYKQISQLLPLDASDLSLYKQKDKIEEYAYSIIQVPFKQSMTSFNALYAASIVGEELKEGEKVEFQPVNGGELVKIEARKALQYQIPPSTREVIFSLKRFTNDSKKDDTAIDFDSLEINKQDYELTAFIVHEGKSLQAGHYISYVKELDNKWYEYNDEERITRTEEEIKEVAKQAYIVKYTKSGESLLLPEAQQGIENLLLIDGKQYKGGGKGNACWLNSSIIFAKSCATLLEEVTDFVQRKASLVDNDKLLKYVDSLAKNNDMKVEQSHQMSSQNYDRGIRKSIGYLESKEDFISSQFSDSRQIQQLSFKESTMFSQKSDDFVDFVREGNIYVDKSLFIKHVLDNGNHLLITCPRRWGKSLNLSMLKAFLQPDGDDKGHYRSEKIESEQYDFSKGNKNKVLFEGGEFKIKKGSKSISKEAKALKISKEVDKDGDAYIETYQGQYPVIYLNLKGAKEDEGYAEHNLDVKLRSAVSNAYKEHGYLYKKMLREEIDAHNRFVDKKIEIHDDDGIKTLEKAMAEINASDNLKKFKAYYNGSKTYKDEAGNNKEAPLDQGISFLSDQLKDYYDREVFVLVDEFDKPVNDILSRGNFLEKIEEAKQVAQKVSDIVAPCSKGTNQSVKQTVLTGILNSEVHEGSSTMNNFHKQGVMTGQLASYFGFTDEEVEELLTKSFLNLQIDQRNKLFEKLKYWYNGQVLGKNTKAFTPSSVMKYLSDLQNFKNNSNDKLPEFQSYWVGTETTSILKTFASISVEKKNDILQKLAMISFNKEVQFFEKNEYNNRALYSILSDLDSDLDTQKANDVFKELVFHYISRSGYITRVCNKDGLYKLPAREVEKVWLMDVLPIWKSALYSNQQGFQDAVQKIDFFNYNAKDVDGKMTKALECVTNKYSNIGEESFRLILDNAIENSSTKSAYKDVEITTGTGRADLIYYYEGTALIYELKYHNNKADGKLEEAIRQIYAQNYMDKVLKLLKVERYQDLNIEIIKLIPVIMYREGNNTKWLYKTGDIKSHTIDEAEEIVAKISTLDEEIATSIEKKETIQKKDKYIEELLNSDKIEISTQKRNSSAKSKLKTKKIKITDVVKHLKKTEIKTERGSKVILEEKVINLIASSYGNFKSNYGSEESINADLKCLKKEKSHRKDFKGLSDQSFNAIAKVLDKFLNKSGGATDLIADALLSDQEIKESLLSLREEFLGRRSEVGSAFYIPQSRVRDQEEVILTNDNIAIELGYWVRSTDRNKFLGIAKLLNKEGGAHHVVLVCGTKVLDEETQENKIEIVIKDPLKNRSKIIDLYEESGKELIDSIASLEKLYTINVDVKSINLGIQKDGESDCAKISLAQLRSQLEDYDEISSLLKNKVSNFESGIASIVENIKDLTNVRELIQEFHEQDKLKSLLSVVRLSNSYGDARNVLLYSNKYIEDDKEFDKVSILDPFGKVGDNFSQARIGLSNIINSEIGKHDNNILFLQLTHKIENNELMGRLLSSFIRFHNSRELSKNLSSELDISDLGKKRKYDKIESDNLDDWLLYIQNNKRELTEKLSKKNDIDQYSRTTQNKKLKKNLNDNEEHEHDSDNMCGEIVENKLGGYPLPQANSLLEHIFKQDQFVKEVTSIKDLEDISKQHKNLYLINPQGSESKFNSELVDFIQRNPSTTVVLADTQKDQSSCFDHSVILSTMISGKLAALGFDDSLYKIGIFYTENEYGKHANIFLSTDLDQGFAEEKLILPAIRYYASTTSIDLSSPHIMKSVKDFELLQIVENVQNRVDGGEFSSNMSPQINISSLTASLYNIEQKMRNIGYDFHKKSGFIKKGSKEDITLQELEYKHDIISELQTELKEKFIQTQILEEYAEAKSLKHAADLSSDLASDSNTLVLSQTKFDSTAQRSDSSLGWFRSVMLRYVFSDELKQVGEVIERTKSRIDTTSNRKLENTLLKDPTSWDKQDQKAIKLVLHPDKNGNSEQSKEDFQLVNGVIQDLKGSSTFSLIQAAYSKVSEKVEKSLGITESAKQTIAKVGDFASKATTVLNAGELVIDSVRMISTPTLENAEKVVLDSAHLYSSIKGMNYFSVGVTAYSATRAGIATASLYWESGEYASAALYGTIAAGDVVVKSAMYIAIPMVLAYANPVFGTGYIVCIAGYTGYHVYSSASLLYHELTHEGQNIKENIQYLSRWSNIDYALSWTPLQLFHDFADSSKFYENEMQKKIKVEKITETLNNLNNKSLAIRQDLYEQNKVGVWKAYSHSLGKAYVLASLGVEGYSIEYGAQDSLVYLGEKIVCGKIIELSDLKEYKCYDSTFGNELGNIILNSDLYIVDHHLSEAL